MKATDERADLVVERGPLDGLLLICPPTIYQDSRGIYVETYNKGLYAAVCPGVEFIQDDICFSRKGVLRGFHGDSVTWKLVSCAVGSLHLAVFDNRSESPTYEGTFQTTLSAWTFGQVLIPPGCANAYQALEDGTCFMYKQSTDYDVSRQFTLGCDDPRAGVRWPMEPTVMSGRDRRSMSSR